MRLHGLGKAFSFIAILAAGTNVAFAQGQLSLANLTGQITDSSGAVVTGVELNLQSKAEGVSLRTTSRETGYYRFESLRPDVYTLTATKAGFSVVSYPNVLLSIGATVSLNITMQLGTVNQQVVVTSQLPALETQTSSLGGEVSAQEATALPLISRDPTGLVNLVPGVTNDLRGSSYGEITAGESLLRDNRLAFSVNGGTRQMASEVVDGVDVTYSMEQFPETPIVISPDFTQELRLETNNLSSEYGRTAGVVILDTKSGTNKFHGSGYEFLQNDDLNANGYFNNKDGIPRPESKRNQFGFAIGGPIIKDKTFFFVDWEQLRDRRALIVQTTVPTAAEAVGDFSNLTTASGQPVILYNPFDTYVDPTTGRTMRRPFANNQIPANMLDSFGKNLLSYYPQPNTPGLITPGGQATGISNLFVDGASPLNFNRFDVKIDHNITSNYRIMGRYSQSSFTTVPVDAYRTAANPTALSQRDYQDAGKNLVVSLTSVLSPSMVVTQALNITRDVEQAINPSKNFNVSTLGGPYASGSVAAFAAKYDGGTAFPNVSITGYGPLGNGEPGGAYNHAVTDYGYQFTLAKTLNSHILKAGFQLALNQLGETYEQGYGGGFTYSGNFTAGPDPLTPSVNTGNGLADLLLGTLNGGDMTTGWTDFTTSHYYAWFLQDDWRVTRKLTLNLGLRYDFETPYQDRLNHLPRLDLNAANPLGAQSGPSSNGQTLNQYFTALDGNAVTGAVVFPSSPGVNGRDVSNTDYKGIQPRLGFAYSPTSNLVLRGGFSKLDWKSQGSAQIITSATGTGLSASTPINGTINGINPAVTTANPFPNGFNTPTYDSLGGLTGVGQDITVGNINDRTPYQWQWNGGFEYSVPKAGVVSVVYAGERSHHLTCPYYDCGDQVASDQIAKYGPALLNTVPNPFYGIITDPTSILSSPTIQLGRLLKQHPEYVNWEDVPGVAYQGPNGDTFRNSWDALEVGFKSPHVHGIAATVAYTVSKNITNADSFEGGYLGPTVGYQNLITFQGERSLSAEDVPQRLVVGYVYELPFGSGKQFASNANPVIKKVVSGWELSSIVTFQSGFPLGISESGHTTGAFGGSDRPNVIGNPCLSSGRSRDQKIVEYLNPSAFQTPPNFTFGDAPRTLNCRADGEKNFDVSVSKNTLITEGVGVDFRAEFYNILNRTELGKPNTNFNGGSFGVITSQYNSPRVIQFGLKVHF
jgi:hypothetical protein